MVPLVIASEISSSLEHRKRVDATVRCIVDDMSASHLQEHDVSIPVRILPILSALVVGPVGAVPKVTQGAKVAVDPVHRLSQILSTALIRRWLWLRDSTCPDICNWNFKSFNNRSLEIGSLIRWIIDIALI